MHSSTRSQPDGVRRFLPGRFWLLAVALAGLTALVYAGVARFAFLNFDDHEYVTENPHVLNGLSWKGLVWAFGSFHASNWHPLTWLSHMLDVALFGLRAGGHHWVNVVWHVANTLLLFATLRLMTRANWRSAMVAALFALHPLHVESVAWVSERKDVLSTFFGLLTIYCYARYGQLPDSTRQTQIMRRRFYWLSLLCFVLGLLCKPMLVTLPALLLLLDFWPLGRMEKGGSFLIARLLREKIPFFMFSVASCVVTLAAQRSAMQTWESYPFLLRLGNALVSYCRYLEKAFWPFDLALPYPYASVWSGGQVAGAVAVLLTITILAWRTRRTIPAMLTGWLWFLGMLVPVIGLVQVGAQAMADRYMYLPLVGLAVAGVWSFGCCADVQRRSVPWLCLLFGVVLAGCGWRTMDQLRHWRDSGTLFAHALAVTRNNDVAYSNLGNHQLEHGAPVDAITNLLQALRTMGGPAAEPEKLIAVLATPGPTDSASQNILGTLERTDGKKLAAFADILGNLGVAYIYTGQTGPGVRCYQAALRIKPDHVLALHNLAAELAGQKQFSAALDLIDRALKAQPDPNPVLYNTRGELLVSLGRSAEALAALEQAAKLDPDKPAPHKNLAELLIAQGDDALAVPHLETVIRLTPSDTLARNELGMALLRLGRTDAAAEQFRALLQVQPDNAAAHDNLGVLLASQGQFAGAAVHLRRAIELAPTNVNTRLNLGNVLASQDDFAGAAVEYAAFLAAKPDHAAAHASYGAVLLELHRRDEAVAQFHEALRIDPAFTPAREQLRVLGVTPD